MPFKTSASSKSFCRLALVRADELADIFTWGVETTFGYANLDELFERVGQSYIHCLHELNLHSQPMAHDANCQFLPM